MPPEAEKEPGIEGFVTLHLPARYGYLRIIRQSVLDIAARAGLTEYKAAQLEMAVDEACTNIIEHSYGGEVEDVTDPEHPGLHVQLTYSRRSILIDLCDYGRGFDFDEQRPISPDEFVQAQR
jgi:serine/threonine-protein kinase RsbW